MIKNAIDILLVEDSENDVELTLRTFKKHNLVNSIHVARDGEQALEFLFGNGHHYGGVNSPPRIILLDLKLPKISGIEVLEKIKSDTRTKTIPVVILTSSREPQDLSKCYSFGANSYVVKPVDFDEFVRAIGEMGLYWLLINKPL